MPPQLDREQMVGRYGSDVFASVSDFRVETNAVEGQKRESIFFDDSINDSTSKDFINRLRGINTKDHTTEVIIRINSNGGTLQGAMDIANYLHYIENPVTTIVESRAMSGAALLLASGDKGRRLAYEDATIMIHQSQITINNWSGSIPQFMEMARERFANNKAFLKALAEATGVSFRQLWHDAAHDLYLTAAEAVDYGIVDRIIPRFKKGIGVRSGIPEGETLIAAAKQEESAANLDTPSEQTVYSS